MHFLKSKLMMHMFELYTHLYSSNDSHERNITMHNLKESTEIQLIG